MDFLTKLKEKVAGATKTAVGKSNEIVEATKLKISINGAENEAEKLLLEIGEAVYNATKSGADPSAIIEANCEALTAKYEEIAVMREKLREYKNIKVCPSCGCEIPSDSAFCNKCGTKAE